MLNLLKKLAPKVAASLVVASTLFAQDSTVSNGNSCAPSCKPACAPKPCSKPCPQPTPPTQICPGQDPCCPSWSTPVLNAGYGYPARTLTRCSWDANFDLSFIYWQPIQENLEIGATLQASGTTFRQNFINQHFDFKPGFKIGLGGYVGDDDWDLRAEYTWFHNTNKASKEVDPTNEILIRATRTQFTGIFDIATGITSPLPSTIVKSYWNLEMDIAQFDLGRWSYLGKKVTIHPSLGLRAAWIRQHSSVTYSAPAQAGGILFLEGFNGTSKSWGMGLKTQLDSSWIIGSGFRLFGSGEADLLYTRYTYLTNKTTVFPESLFKNTQKGVASIKTHIDLEIGLGWGTYIDCNKWYLDFAASYGFQTFFDQNMFRNFSQGTLTESGAPNSSMPNGNLYVQGLTLTGKLEF